MKLHWTSRARSDLSRLHDFIAPHNPAAAARLLHSLLAATEKLLITPRIGERAGDFGSKEVRRILVGQYEILYEIKGNAIVITRLWHTRQNR